MVRENVIKMIFFEYAYAEYYAEIHHLKETAQRSYRCSYYSHLCMYPDMILVHSCYLNKPTAIIIHMLLMTELVSERIRNCPSLHSKLDPGGLVFHAMPL
jgi:hypothetical protein